MPGTSEQPAKPKIPSSDRTPAQVVIDKIVNTGQKYSIAIIFFIFVLLLSLVTVRKKRK